MATTNNSSDTERIEIDGQTVTAYSSSGNILWVKNLETDINKGCIKDLDNDGENEVIIGTGPTGKYPGYLFVYKSNGSKIFDFKAGDIRVYGRSDYYEIYEILFDDFDKNGDLEIVINSLNSPWYPARIIVLNHTGGLISEYWHPGHVYSIIIADYKNDGKNEIICGGLNNDYEEKPIFFILDPLNSKGQAPPYRGYEVEGNELEYVILSKSEINPNYCCIQNIKIIGDKLEFTTSDGRFFYYSLKNLDFLYIAHGDYYRFQMDELEQEKEKEKEELKQKEEQERIELFRSILLVVIGAILGAFISFLFNRISLKRKQKKVDKKTESKPFQKIEQETLSDQQQEYSSQIQPIIEPQQIKQHFCPTCHQQFTHILQSNRYYCYQCKKYE